MQSLPKIQRPRVALWTRERIAELATYEVRQLHANATRLQESEIALLCDSVLAERRRSRTPVRRARRERGARRLISRGHAFGLRGVDLRSHLWSRGGVRSSDGVVVMALWADDVRNEGGVCSCLLWAPNEDGSRPWSDKPGGKERLEQCQLALVQGKAEGLLVYGERLDGMLPEDRVLRIDGVDPNVVLILHIERRSEEYWATWGGESTAPFQRHRALSTGGGSS